MRNAEFGIKINSECGIETECMKNIGFPKNEGCTRNFLGRGSVSLHQPRASFTNITAEPYKIRAGKASVDDVGDGSRLPTRSNRKTIATGNLRPRRPEHTNKRHNINSNKQSER